MFSRGERSLYCRARSWPTSLRKPLFMPGWPMSWAMAAINKAYCSSSPKKASEPVALIIRATPWTTSTAWAKLWNATGRYSFSTAATKRWRTWRSSAVFTNPSSCPWKVEMMKVPREIRCCFVRGSVLNPSESNTSCVTPSSCACARTFSAAETEPFLRMFCGFLSVTFFAWLIEVTPCIISRMAMSSEPMSFVSTTCVLLRSATIASLLTTFSKSFISFELSTSRSSSSSPPSSSMPSLSLKTVVAMSRTEPSIRSRGRTAMFMTTLESARPLNTMMKMMKHVVAIPVPAVIWWLWCMLKPTMKVSVCTKRALAILGGVFSFVPSQDASLVSVLLHSNMLLPSMTTGLPEQAVYGPYS
mmetsp:Transcript_45482/g.134616  ORF Transcript_45482/g.134616 Transcript_45482/m.134616 type:complete len:359 (+) Transcript_45482:737-1813(+)